MVESEDQGDWMTAEQVCRFKNWSRSTLYLKVKQGLVIRHKTKGQSPMYRRSELTIDAIMARATELENKQPAGARA